MIQRRFAPRVLRLGMAAALAAAVLAGCSSAGKKPEPRPLEPIVAATSASPAWTHRVDAADFSLSVAVSPYD